MDTSQPKSQSVPEGELSRVIELVKSYKGLAFCEDRIGKLNTAPSHLDYDPNFQPPQPPYRKVLIHYQSKMSNLLEFLQKENVITDIDRRNSDDCIMNVVITDNKNGEIRMNIDNTPRNPGIRRTKAHVQTPQEIRHELTEAKVFSEMDIV